MKVAVAGLWHLGCVTAACLASVGHEVVAYDDDFDLVANLRQGRPPISEPGLGEMISVGMAQKRLSFTTEPGDVGDAQVLWICYDTPIDKNDVADVEFVFGRVIRLLQQLRGGALVLISSQIPVGTTARLEAHYRGTAPEKQLSFACIPENLRLGKAIEVFTHPDCVVAGTRSHADRALISSLLQPITDRIVWMSVESAEMTKHARNAFLATSIVFINEIAALCEQVGADALEVECGLKGDARIGPGAYLHAGAAFSGGTLARDVRFLLDLSCRRKVDAKLLSGVEQSNARHQNWTRDRIVEFLGNVTGKTVAVLGLTYKPGTSTLRRSSAIETCHWLHDHGATVRAFDPAVNALPASLAPEIHLANSAPAALEQADGAVIATPWPDFLALSPNTFVSKMRFALVIDPARHLQLTVGADARIKYVAVGWSTPPAIAAEHGVDA